MAGLKPKDLDFALHMRELEIFDDIDHNLVDASNGVILDFCGDGDHSHDIFTYQTRVCNNPRIHLIASNGGPHRLVRDSPVNKPGRTTDLDGLDTIATSAVLKNIWTVVLNSHATCGHSMDFYGLSLEECCNLHISAKMRVKTDLPKLVPEVVAALRVRFPEQSYDHLTPQKLKVLTFKHIYWNDEKKKSYHFNVDRWRQFQSGGGDELLAAARERKYLKASA